MRIKDTDWSMAKKVICHTLYNNNDHREVVKRRFLLLDGGLAVLTMKELRSTTQKCVQKEFLENRAFHFFTDQKGYLSGAP